MTNIPGLKFSVEALLLAVEAGRVTRRFHDEYNYSIFNYSDEVTFSGQWDDITRACRGLILDNSDFSIVARPWEKFFNLGQMAMEIQPTDPCEVMDKADGSLGILYPDPIHGFSISTRGSFHSEQAEHATALWKQYYDDDMRGALYSHAAPYTFMFEIIYPENQIVLDYGEMDDLILLGAVEKATGYYYGPLEAQAILGWTGPVIEVFKHNSISGALRDTARDNAEGFVLRSHNYMVKIKQVDYLDKHRLRFHLTPKNIWEEMAKGTNIVDMVKILPDEFQRSIMEIADGFNRAYVDMSLELGLEWGKYGKITDRKEFAAAVQASPHRAALFQMFDNKSVDKYIWNSIKPKKV